MREGVNRGTRQNTPSSSRRRRDQIQVCDESKGIGAKTEAEEEEEEDEEDGDRYGETPKGTPVEVFRVGGGFPAQRNSQTSWTSPLNVSTCCCGKST